MRSEGDWGSGVVFWVGIIGLESMEVFPVYF